MSAPSRLSPTEALGQDHRERLNSDYYTFLQLPHTCTKEEIETSCKRLAQRWRSAANSENLEDRARQQAKELLGGLRQVWDTFKDEFARRGYDQRLEMGTAPMVRTEASVELSQILGDLPGGTSPKTIDEPELGLFEQGQKLLEEQKFQMAYKVLDKARQDEPSDPDILAALGWAAYHIKHREKLDDDPEDYLKLALTFEPSHQQALEFMARISLKKGDLESAEELLGRLVKINPEAGWAKRELQQIRSAQSSEPNRRFWRRGDDG